MPAANWAVVARRANRVPGGHGKQARWAAPGLVRALRARENREQVVARDWLTDPRNGASVNVVARPAPADDGSPARLIATMVGIVGILLLGSLAWSAVGALFSAVGEATHALSSGTPAPKLALGGSGAPTPRSSDAAAAPSSVGLTQTPQASVPPHTPTPGPTSTDVPSVEVPSTEPTPTSTPAPSPVSTPTPVAGGRSPWILLPGPAPDSRVQPGAQVIEARGRGDSIITAIRLELDGAALSVSLEQRSESVWRGSSTVQVAAGHHAVRATVVDDQGRTGSFRWTFDAGP